jgi:DNA-binding PadR family transcriptional regulator
MDLAGEVLRGHAEAIILSVLADGDSYGYAINVVIAHRSGNGTMLTEATLYNAFRRLEADGCITSYWREGINNTKRRYYTITEHGRKVLDDHRRDFAESVRILRQMLGGNDNG